MLYQLQAPNKSAFNLSVLEADINGLDPEYDNQTLTMEIGTGQIEKVRRLVTKYNLVVLFEKEYGYSNEAYIRAATSGTILKGGVNLQ
jgi:hypothetical protein